jgi:radical SAM protein with 4Fe4S-binding SPASM domain
MHRFRIVTQATNLSVSARRSIESYVAQDPCSIELVAAPEQLGPPASGVEVIDLLHVPVGAAIDRQLGRRFASSSRGARLGILSDSAGVHVASASRAAVERFFHPRGDQDDLSVYESGARFLSGGGGGDEVPLPRQVYLGLTQRCNRSCSFCVSRTFHYDWLSMDQVREVAEALRDDVEVIALTGAGEAMMHPQFWEIADMLHELRPDVRFKMNTSGVALRRNADRLMRYPFKNITVSLNAGTPETYERFVGPGFHVVLNGIETLVAARVRARCDDLRLCLSVVLMNSTVVEMPRVVEMAFELGVEEVQGIYLMLNDDRLAPESPWHEPERSNEWLDWTERRAAALGVHASLPPRFRTGDSRADRAQTASLPTTQGQRCVEPWSTTYVRPNGDVMACPYMDRNLGSLRRSDLASIWRGREYQRLRQSLVSGERWEECRHCCGFNETGSVNDYRAHWLGTRRPQGTIPLTPI